MHKYKGCSELSWLLIQATYEHSEHYEDELRRSQYLPSCGSLALWVPRRARVLHVLVP